MVPLLSPGGFARLNPSPGKHVGEVIVLAAVAVVLSAVRVRGKRIPEEEK